MSVRGPRLLSLVSALGCLAAFPAAADSLEDFYKGAQMRMIIRSEAGGTYDFYSRMLSKYMRAHVPGHPLFINVNMPGGGGIVAANYVAKVAPRDGTILSMIGLGLPVDQALGLSKSFQVDLRDFTWLGSISSSNQVLVMWHTSKIKTLEDAERGQSTVGSTGAGSVSQQYPSFYNAFLGTKFKIVFGYASSVHINLAMERGEVEGSGSTGWAQYLIDTPHYVRNKLIVPIVQTGLKKEPDLPAVPLLLDLAKTPDEKAAYRFMSEAVDFGRPIASTPGVPPERAAMLREAFAKTMTDPGFVAEVKKQGGEVRPATGDEVAAIVRGLIETPEPVRAKVKAAISERQ
jgi:tripartite-type tricarboxylate transporter receptor subunit TctC